jgi:hypothetical protein
MTAAGRSRLHVFFAALLLGVVFVAIAGPADAQTATTVPPATTAAPAPSTTVVTAGDEASTRTVKRIVLVLVLFAIVLVGMAIWFWRATKPVPRHLDGLDMMGSRRWREGGPPERSALLAPVHERRSDERDGDLIAEPEEPVAAVSGSESDEAEDEPTPRAS